MPNFWKNNPKWNPRREPISWKMWKKTRCENSNGKETSRTRGRRVVRAPLLRLHHLFSSCIRLVSDSSSSLVFILSSPYHVFSIISRFPWCFWFPVFELSRFFLISSVFCSSRLRPITHRNVCSKLTARSLKRSMLHTCSGVISGCEFKWLRHTRRPHI